jgi:hypothetical protein
MQQRVDAEILHALEILNERHDSDLIISDAYVVVTDMAERFNEVEYIFNRLRFHSHGRQIIEANDRTYLVVSDEYFPHITSLQDIYDSIDAVFTGNAARIFYENLFSRLPLYLEIDGVLVMDIFEMRYIENFPIYPIDIHDWVQITYESTEIFDARVILPAEAWVAEPPILDSGFFREFAQVQEREMLLSFILTNDGWRIDSMVIITFDQAIRTFEGEININVEVDTHNAR